MGGNGGSFGGKGGKGGVYAGKGGPGGGGAALGGAIFIRAGTLTLVDSSFLNNRAQGGSGVADSDATGGQGKGGAIFLLTPATMTMTGCATFSGNNAANAAGSGSDTHDLYGKTLTALPLCATGSTAGAAVAVVAAADSGAVDAAQPLTVTALAAAPVVTASVPVSVPVAVEVAPVVTDSVPVSMPVAVDLAPVVTESVPVSVAVVETAPVVAEAPAVATTQAVTAGDAAAPVDANAPAAPDTSGQNQQIFLPIITNLAGAALGSPGGIALLVLVGIVVVGTLVRRRQQRNR